MSGREASGIRRLMARLFGRLGSAGAAARPPPGTVAKRTLRVARPVAAGQALAARGAREREHERMQRRVRRTREAYVRLRRAGSAPR
jgi:hypothetical protein